MDKIIEVVVGLLTLLQVCYFFLFAHIFKKIDEKQDKMMCEEVSKNIKKELQRGDNQFRDILAELKKHTEAFSKTTVDLRLAIQRLEAVERKNIPAGNTLTNLKDQTMQGGV